ncbi:MAG: tetratricopeptide repeat protein [Chlorobi bacterium]|nr:tetratricopeptide repeat protein [Chlorobiota bacterium]
MKKARSINYLAIIVAAIFLTNCGGVNKMVKMAPEVSYNVSPSVLEMHGDSVEITVSGKFPAKYFNKKAILTATPVIKTNSNEIPFKAYVCQGESVEANNQVISFVNGGGFSYTDKIPYTEDMRVSALNLKLSAAIGSNAVDLPLVKLADGVVSTPLLLEVDPKAIKAKDKFVRITNDSYGADIHYVINRAEVRKSELRQDDIKALENFIAEAAEKENSHFKGAEILAYASPDGAEDLNAKLADKREKSAQAFLTKRFKKAKTDAYKAEDFLTSKETPEDWDGFKKLMEKSDIQDKELILRVLSMYSDPDVREKEIKNISKAYEIIAKDVLPKLRRSKLNVNVDIVGYSDEELLTLIDSIPDSLNVEELLKAATLTNDLDKQLMVYQTIIKNVPECWRGHNNAGYVYIQKGMLDEAEKAFEDALNLKKDNTIVLNNLGVVNHLKGDLAKAMEYYDAAAGAGDEVSYNKGLIAIKTGDYAKALDNEYFKQPSFNFALAKVLNYSNTKNSGTFDAALGILNKIENQDDPAIYYLKAIIGARQQNSDLMYNNLRTAVEKDAKYKSLASTDIEFSKYFDDSTFITITQ